MSHSLEIMLCVLVPGMATMVYTIIHSQPLLQNAIVFSILAGNKIICVDLPSSTHGINNATPD